MIGERLLSYGLDLPTSSTITGVRGVAGGRQPGRGETPLCYLYSYSGVYYMFEGHQSTSPPGISPFGFGHPVDWGDSVVKGITLGYW